MKRLLLALVLTVISFPAFAADKETAYDRVLRTGTIRCGYGTADPWLIIDTKTGQMTGFLKDIMEEIAKNLSLKLEWPEETGWANMPTSIATGRVDMSCSTLWIDPARGRQVAYTRPIFYNAIYVYARESDAKFNKSTNLNSPDVKIVIQDGDASEALAKRHFPNATFISLPSTASSAEFYENVVTGKADILFSESIAVKKYNDSRQDKEKLRRIPGSEPLTVYASAFAVNIKDHAMKEMIDAAVLYLLDNGFMDDAITRFNKQYPDAVIPIEKTYKRTQ